MKICTFPTFPMAVPIRVVVGPPNDDVNRLAVPLRNDDGGRGPLLQMSVKTIILRRAKLYIPPRVTGRYCNGESTATASPPPPRRETGLFEERVDPAESIF